MPTRTNTGDLTITTEPQIPLLKDIINILLDGATYFTGDTERAQRARNKLRKKTDPDDREFFAILFEDLKKADGVIKGVPSTWTDGKGAGQQAICQVLDVVQRDYLDDDSSDDDGDERNADLPDIAYARLRQFVFEYKPQARTQIQETLDEHKLVMLCDSIKLERTKTKSRKHLLDSINKCHDALKSASVHSALADISYRGIDPGTTIYSTKLFFNAERLHKTLIKTWTCDCFDDGSQLHQRACFSFDNAADAETERVSGAMLFETVEQDAKIWRFARYEFQPSEHVDKRLPGTAVPHLCDTLDQCEHSRLVKIVGEMVALEDRIPGDQTGGSKALDKRYRNESPLTACFKLEPGHAVFSLTEKRRMILALYLVYAYLNLGGGAFWPYDRRTSVMFDDQIGTDGSIGVFFAASLVKEQADDSFGWLYRQNAAMPSLVALGQLLMSLYLGRYVYLDTIDKEIENCAEKLMGLQIVQAVSSCIAPGDADKTIRTDERLRQKFQNEVVLPIQAILLHGFTMPVKDVFAPSPPMRVLEAPLPRRVRSSTPAPSDRVEQIPSGYCLHDGSGVSKLDIDQAATAIEALKKIQTCIATTLYDLPKAPRGSKGPVKIALLDTGADISEEYLSEVYSQRLRENKTWLATRKKEGEHLVDVNGVKVLDEPLDANGHGTHGCSVLLEATLDTDIQVYVAQVFKAARDKVVKDVILDDPTVARVSNAIRHAVDVWKVDIISMSFGFPKEVPEIAAAIDYAHKKDVLMLAAAANCGVIATRSWPARDDRTLCIYAADGLGNKYNRNPDPAQNEPNYSTLGCSVEALWPPVSKDKPATRECKSGTSTATPIAAAIAALVISSMRQCEDQFIEAARSTGQDMEALRREHRRRTAELGRASRMRKIFGKMQTERDGYLVLTPWTLFKPGATGLQLAETILYDT